MESSLAVATVFSWFGAAMLRARRTRTFLQNSL